MKKSFYLGCLGLALFEVANVYFIMPMPGSQEVESLAAAYFLHRWRWAFRGVFALMAIIGAKSAFSHQKWLATAALAAVGGLAYFANFEMAAEAMFEQPRSLVFKKGAENRVAADRLVIGIERGGEAKAYPIQFIGHHHQVVDTLGGRPVIVTYCTVCRTGRAFEPLIDGRPDRFRLVGMDRWNAMFEDSRTGSWWRQATGEAVAGPLKGRSLPEVPTAQATLGKWLELFPNSLVMQPDEGFREIYDSLANYETGKRKGKLTRRDSLSWQPKSWVVGVVIGGQAHAFDWNELQQARVLTQKIGDREVAVCLATDGASFAAFELQPGQRLELSGDTLRAGGRSFDFLGRPLDGAAGGLRRVAAYQEYWHSWQAFHPAGD